MRILKGSGIVIVMVTVSLLVASCGGSSGLSSDADAAGSPSSANRWIMTAGDGLMIGGYGDNFDYAGTSVRSGPGNATLNVRTDNETGSLVAVWNGTHTPASATTHTGEIKIVMKTWAGVPPFQEGGIADDWFIHGDTGFGPPVMPTVHAFLSGWGIADVYINGVLTYPGLDGHFMYTDGARQPSGKILKADMTTPYSPGDPGNSYVDPSDRELHIVAHSTVVDAGNFPPHTVWFHMNFETPTIHKAPAGALK